MRLRTLLLPLAAALALASSASAHFVWIHVLAGGGSRVEIFFGDGVWEDTEPSLLRYVEGVELWTPAGTTLDPVAEPHALSTRLPAGETVVLGRRDMGVFSRPGAGAPVKLDYYAKGTAALAGAAEPRGTRAEVIARADGDELVLQVLFDGSPAPGATVIVPRHDSIATDEHEADAEGRVRVPRPRSGVFAVRAKVAVPEPGEHDGEAYRAEHHWATLTVASVGTTAGATTSGAATDPDAWLALEEARRLRDRLPAGIVGLAGVLEVQVDSRAWHGEFDYQEGRLRQLELEGNVDDATRTWIAAHVAAMVTDRLALDRGGDEPSRALHAAPRDGHPLGRLIEVDDDACTRFRLRERHIVAVERSEGPLRTSTVVLDHDETEAGRFVPREVTRTTYDRESGALRVTESWSDTRLDVDGLLLPATRRVVRASDEGETTLAIRMRNLERFDETTTAD